MGRLVETFGIFYIGLGDIFIWAKKIVSPYISKSFNNNLCVFNIL